MPLSFMNDTVTVLRAPIIEKNGMEKRDWSNAVDFEVADVMITSQNTSRDFEDRTLQVSDRRTLRANYDADIKAGDRIVWNGSTYEVDGDVFHTKSPTGRVSSTRCALVRWAG